MNIHQTNRTGSRAFSACKPDVCFAEEIYQKIMQERHEDLERQDDRTGTVAKLKNNLARFSKLNPEEREVLLTALEEQQSNVERLVPSGVWHPMHCRFLAESRRYRLSPTYNKPAPRKAYCECRERKAYQYA